MTDKIYWRLDGDNNVVPCSRDEWSDDKKGMKDVVRQYKDGDKFVSTILIGLSINGDGLDMFETMAWHPQLDDPMQQRCDTYEEALRQHEAMVEVVKALDLTLE